MLLFSASAFLAAGLVIFRLFCYFPSFLKERDRRKEEVLCCCGGGLRVNTRRRNGLANVVGAMPIDVYGSSSSSSSSPSSSSSSSSASSSTRSAAGTTWKNQRINTSVWMMRAVSRRANRKFRPCRSCLLVLKLRCTRMRSAGELPPLAIHPQQAPTSAEFSPRILHGRFRSCFEYQRMVNITP